MVRIGGQNLAAQLLGTFQLPTEVLLLGLGRQEIEIRCTYTLGFTAPFVFSPTTAEAGIVPARFHAQYW